jgi:hypothetical protein
VIDPKITQKRIEILSKKIAPNVYEEIKNE